MKFEKYIKKIYRNIKFKKSVTRLMFLEFSFFQALSGITNYPKWLLNVKHLELFRQ